MREIKFRAWDKKRRRLTSVRSMEFGTEGIYLTVYTEDGDSTYYTLKKPGEYELIQFTGLLGKNGKEIYEADVVQGWEEIDMDTGIGIDTKEIETFKLAVEWDEQVCGWNLYGANTFEIIGNIYENSDLLTTPLK